MRCRVPLGEPQDVLLALGMPEDLVEGHELYRAVGCNSCSNTGYRGRLGLHEVMPLTDELEQLIVTRATGTEMRELALAQGMIALRDDGWSKAAQGLTTVEEVLRVSV